MNTIKIKDKEYNIKYSLRTLFIFEQITGRPFEINTLLDNYIFFYSMILASNKNDEPLDWDDYIDALDNDPNLIKQMSEIIASQQKQDKLFNTDNAEGKKK